MKLSFASVLTLMQLLSFYYSYAQNCEMHRDTILYRIQVKPNRKVVISPSPENSTEFAYIANEFDLNGDGINELLVDLGVCGNNVCVSAVYSPDKDGNYKCILQPNFWWRIECSAVKTNGWKNLMIYEEPFYRFAGQQENMTLVEFIEPSPFHYIFYQNRFVKTEGIQISSQL